MKVDKEFEPIGTLKASKIMKARLCWLTCHDCGRGWKKTATRFLNLIVTTKSVFYICDTCAENPKYEAS